MKSSMLLPCVWLVVVHKLEGMISDEMRSRKSLLLNWVRWEVQRIDSVNRRKIGRIVVPKSKPKGLLSEVAKVLLVIFSAPVMYAYNFAAASFSLSGSLAKTSARLNQRLIDNFSSISFAEYEFECTSY